MTSSDQESKRRVGTYHQAAFSAEATTVVTIPSFNYAKKLPMTSARKSMHIGPFVAGMQYDLPIWVAKILHERQLAMIQMPDWLDADRLVSILHFEKNNETFSKELPFYYFEMSRILGPILPKATHLLVQDISSIRLDKLRTQFQEMSKGILQQFDPSSGDFPMIAVSGIASIELSLLGPFLRQAMGDFDHVTSVDQAAGQSPFDTGAGADSDADIGADVDANVRVRSPEAPRAAGPKVQPSSRLRRFRKT